MMFIKKCERNCPKKRKRMRCGANGLAYKTSTYDYFAGAADYKTNINREDVDTVEAEYCSRPTADGCDVLFSHRCSEILRVGGRVMPNDLQSAVNLFHWLSPQV